MRGELIDAGRWRPAFHHRGARNHHAVHFEQSIRRQAAQLQLPAEHREVGASGAEQVQIPVDEQLDLGAALRIELREAAHEPARCEGLGHHQPQLSDTADVPHAGGRLPDDIERRLDLREVLPADIRQGGRRG